MSKYDDDKNKPSLDWVDTDLLQVDNSYQRSIEGVRSQIIIDNIIKNFSWSEFSPITVAKTDTGFYNVIDGQHRFVAASKLKIEKLPCWIIKKTTVADEADTFIGINKNRVQVNNFSMFKARLAKGEEDAVSIQDFCDKNHIAIPASGYVSKPNQTLSLNVIAMNIKKHNEAYLAEAFKLIREALPTLIGQLRADILKTIIKIKIEYGAKIKNEEIIAALKAFGDTSLISIKAAQLKSLDSSIRKLDEAHFKVFCSKIADLRKAAKYE